MTNAVPGHGDRIPVYLDTASSEPLHPAARETFLAALDQGYADPRRLHRTARSARLLLDNARAAVSESLDVRPDEVTFTASGTEAVHRGLLGLARARSSRGSVLVHSAVEHSAVLHAADWGGKPVSVPVDARGRVDAADFIERCARPRRRRGRAANREPRGRDPAARRRVPAAERRPPLRGRLRVHGSPAPARRLVRRGGLRPQVGRPGGGRDPAGAHRGPVEQPVPRRRPSRSPDLRLRERPCGAGRSRCPAGGRGRTRRGERAPVRPDRPDPLRCRRNPGHRGGR